MSAVRTMTDFVAEAKRITANDPRLTKGSTVLDCGLLLLDAAANLTAEQFEKLTHRIPWLVSEQTGQRTADKHSRLMTIARIAALHRFRSRLPAGWAAMRQIPCLARSLGEKALEKAFRDGLITAATTREQLDAMRSLARGKPIAARHPSKKMDERDAE